MPTLTVTFREIFKGAGVYSHIIDIDGLTLVGLTDETPADARDRFIALVRDRIDEIAAILRAQDEKRKWNHRESDAGRKGRNWPEFARRDRIVDELCKQAGIKDS